MYLILVLWSHKLHKKDISPYCCEERTLYHSDCIVKSCPNHILQVQHLSLRGKSLLWLDQETTLDLQLQFYGMASKQKTLVTYTYMYINYFLNRTPFQFSNLFDREGFRSGVITTITELSPVSMEFGKDSLEGISIEQISP